MLFAVAVSFLFLLMISDWISCLDNCDVSILMMSDLFSDMVLVLAPELSCCESLRLEHHDVCLLT